MAAFVPSTTYDPGIECIPITATMPATGTEYTLMGWVYLPTAVAVASYRSFFAMQGTSNGFWIGTGGDGQTFIITNYSTTTYSGDLLPLATWIHIAGVYISRGSGDSTFRGYINGKLNIDVTDTLAIDDFNYLPMIGNYTRSYPVNGNLSEIRVWSRALRQDEIVREMRSNRVVSKNKLYVSIPLETSMTRDDSGLNNTTNTISGSPTFVRGPNRIPEIVD